MSKTKKSPAKSLNNAYRAGVLQVNRQRKKDAKFSNRLNYMKRHLQTWLKDSKDAAMEGLYDKKASDAKAFRTQFLFWLFIDEFRYDLAVNMLPDNPNGENRTPKHIIAEIQKGENFRTLQLSDREKVELANVTGAPEYEGEMLGGISIFRILQISYGVHKYIIKEMGNGYLKKDLTETKVMKAIEEYKEQQAKNTLARRAESEDDEDEVIVEDHAIEFVESDSTVADIIEALENGEIKSTDLTDAEKIKEAREHASGGTKGALTRQLNKLVEA